VSIEVDLDQPPAPTRQPSWLDRPTRVVAGVAAVGVVAIAVAAVTFPSWRATPAPAAAPTPVAEVCLRGAAPLPAFTITTGVTGDLYDYEDTGRWTWQQMVWIPAAFATQDGLQLIELQVASADRPVITVETGGPHRLVARAKAGAEVPLDFAPAAVYDRWVSLSVTSTDVPSGDVLTVTLLDADGSTTSQDVPPGLVSHGALTGFRLMTPLGDAPGPAPEVKYGPPAFSATC
jgi:hypothetical protein